MLNILDKYLLDKEIPTDGVGIYALKLRGKVVYVGQTINIKKRIAAHLGDDEKEFDDVEFYECDNSELNNKEAEMIVKLDPYGNRRLPKNDIFLTIGVVDRLISEKIRENSLKWKEYESKGHGGAKPILYYRKSKVESLMEKVATLIDSELGE